MAFSAAAAFLALVDFALTAFGLALRLAGVAAASAPVGLPRYAKQAVDQQFARWVMLHVPSNPLPICSIGSDTFVVQGEPERRDPDRLVWRVDARPT
jgi:hypothetical protein